MAFTAYGFKSLGVMGSPVTTAGSRRKIHTYITNDLASAVETSDYFLSIYQQLVAGDILHVVADWDGSPTLRSYYFATVGSGGVTIARETTAVTGDQTAVPDLTENSTTIGGTNDGNLPVLTATAAALTGTLTGTTDGALADIAATAAATAGGATPSATQVDTGIALAVSTIVTGTNLQLKEIQTVVNALVADNTDNIAAIRELATIINTILARLRSAGLLAA